jgi:NAD(P)-dependent dehydrogenase (short-subunit alcohol dehydrogenase family)
MPLTDSHGLKVVVITGSTRGIGFGLAKAFLERGCAVTVSGRTQAAVDHAVLVLAADHGAERVSGFACDVVLFEQVQTLWEASVQRFGRVDIWINNAGIAQPMSDFWMHTPQQYEAVLQTNLLGTMYGMRVAVNGMLAQGSGAVYNLEGFGSDGRIMRGMTLYGSSKAAMHYLDRALAKELKGKAVILGAIAPGMVITELVTSQYEGRPADLEKVKPIFNIISERVETVAPIIAEKVLTNHKNGAHIRPFGPGYLLWKFATAPFHKRDLFGEA